MIEDLDETRIEEVSVLGFDCAHDPDLGHLVVHHDGAITWEQLQAIKNAVWGKDARAIEVYPVQGSVVNTGPYRHLWRLGAADFCPDLLGHEPGDVPSDPADLLEVRHARAWCEAEEVFR